MYNENYYYGEYNTNNTKNKFSLSNLNLKGKLILGGVLLIVLIIVTIVINNILSYYNSYEYLEKQMIDATKNYVTNNNLIIGDEIYIDVSKLNMNIKDNCSKISGVFVDNNYNYQAYLSCDNYQSDIINNNETKVSLNGEEVILLAKGINYIEPGIKGSREVIIQGEVGTEEGVYNLSYFVNQNNIPIAVLKRKVVIVDNLYIKSLFPTITLKGESIVYIQKGDHYNDSGVLAGDSVDFDLTNKVKVNNNVDINNEGEYEISYTVTNSRGYTNRVIRKVVVINNFSTTMMTASLSTNNKTNNDVTINIKIIGNEYDYVLLPDKSMTRSTDISYKISSNGTYNFVAYDKDGKSTTKIVPITNIDKEKPTGVCNAIIYNDYANIVVNPNSGKKISSYKYIVNGISSNELTSSSYKAIVNNNNVNSVSVIIKDSVGNNNTITCNITYADPSVGNPNVKYYTFMNEEYVIAKTKNDLDSFVSRVTNRISQSADIPNCGDSCMSFSEYHMYVLQYGNMDSMNLQHACGWYHSTKINKIYTGIDNIAKQKALKMVYDEIFSGRVIMLQITGTEEKNSRHFGVVVGYRRKVYNASSLREEDLIYIDAWDGKLKTLDPNLGATRSMFNEPHKGGWMVGVIKPEYYA